MNKSLAWIFLIIGVAVFAVLAVINHTLEQIRNHLAAVSDNIYRATRKYEDKDY